MIPTYEKDSRLEFLNFLILIQFRKDFDIIKYTIFWEKMGFWQKYSTTHALNHLNNSLINDMDRGNYTCWILNDFQKNFYTVAHHKSLKKIVLWNQRKSK